MKNRGLHWINEIPVKLSEQCFGIFCVISSLQIRKKNSSSHQRRLAQLQLPQAKRACSHGKRGNLHILHTDTTASQCTLRTLPSLLTFTHFDWACNLHTFYALFSHFLRTFYGFSALFTHFTQCIRCAHFAHFTHFCRTFYVFFWFTYFMHFHLARNLRTFYALCALYLFYFTHFDWVCNLRIFLTHFFTFFYVLSTHPVYSVCALCALYILVTRFLRTFSALFYLAHFTQFAHFYAFAHFAARTFCALFTHLLHTLRTLWHTTLCTFYALRALCAHFPCAFYTLFTHFLRT